MSLELRARWTARDPGHLALRRAARATLASSLAVLLVWGTSRLTGQSPRSLALALPISIFGSVIVRGADARTRAFGTLALVGASAASFSLSAWVRNAWVNHSLFVAVIFAAVYARRFGAHASAAGFGAFVSFFFAAFLKPPLATLPWQLLGLLLASIAIALAAFVLLPERPAVELDAALRAIARRLALLLAPIERACRNRGTNLERDRLRKQLELFQETIRVSKGRLDALDIGGTAHPLSFRLFELETAAQRTVQLAVDEPERCRPESLEQLTGLRNRLRELRPRASGPPRDGALAAALAELEGAFERACRARNEAGVRREPASASSASDPTPSPAGLRPQTRLAIQASAACALAIAGGELLSPQRWYWAVITVFVMFTGTASRGDAWYKGGQRVLGTLLGVFAGMGLVWLARGDRGLELALLGLAIFLTYYFFTEHYAEMVFCLTVLLALLFALIGRYSPQVLWLRVEETVLGAAAGILVAGVLLPRTTRGQARAGALAYLEALRELVDASLSRLTAVDSPALGTHSRKVDGAFAALHSSLRPLRIDRFGDGAWVHAQVTQALQSAHYWLHELTLAARTSARSASEAARRALEAEGQRFDAQIDGLVHSLREGNPTDPACEPRRLAPARPPRSPDERVEVARHALAHLCEAVAHLGGALAVRQKRQHAAAHVDQPSRAGSE